MPCVTGCLERLFWLFSCRRPFCSCPRRFARSPMRARDVYGNVLSVPGYGYPPGYPADGYTDNYPLVTRPASRPRASGCGPDDRICLRRPALPVYEPEDEGSVDYAISPQYERQVVAYRGGETARNGHHRYTVEISLSRPAGRTRDPLRHRCWPPGLRMGRAANRSR